MQTSMLTHVHAYILYHTHTQTDMLIHVHAYTQYTIHIHTYTIPHTHSTPPHTHFVMHVSRIIARPGTRLSLYSYGNLCFHTISYGPIRSLPSAPPRPPSHLYLSKFMFPFCLENDNQKEASSTPPKTQIKTNKLKREKREPIKQKISNKTKSTQKQ